LIVVEAVLAAFVAVTVTLCVILVAVPEAVNVRVYRPLCAAADADNPFPSPDAERLVTVPLTVSVTWPEEPRDTVNEVGLAEIVYFVAVLLTVSVTVVECDRLPLVPVILIEYVPAATVDPTVNFAVELP
jgi:hypothetical protein